MTVICHFLKNDVEFFHAVSSKDLRITLFCVIRTFFARAGSCWLVPECRANALWKKPSSVCCTSARRQADDANPERAAPRSKGCSIIDNTRKSLHLNVMERDSSLLYKFSGTIDSGCVEFECGFAVYTFRFSHLR